MSEKEWAELAAKRGLDPKTGSKGSFREFLEEDTDLISETAFPQMNRLFNQFEDESRKSSEDTIADRESRDEEKQGRSGRNRVGPTLDIRPITDGLDDISEKLRIQGIVLASSYQEHTKTNQLLTRLVEAGGTGGGGGGGIGSVIGGLAGGAATGGIGAWLGGLLSSIGLGGLIAGGTAAGVAGAAIYEGMQGGGYASGTPGHPEDGHLKSFTSGNKDKTPPVDTRRADQTTKDKGDLEESKGELAALDKMRADYDKEIQKTQADLDKGQDARDQKNYEIDMKIYEIKKSLYDKKIDEKTAADLIARQEKDRQTQLTNLNQQLEVLMKKQIEEMERGVQIARLNNELKEKIAAGESAVARDSIPDKQPTSIAAAPPATPPISDGTPNPIQGGGIAGTPTDHPSADDAIATHRGGAGGIGSEGIRGSGHQGGQGISGTGASRPSGSLAGNEQVVYDTLRKLGYDDETAKVMTASVAGENLANPSHQYHDPSRKNPAQTAQGMGAWDDTRARQIQEHFGKLPKDMSVAEQTEAYDWELKTHYRDTYNKVRAGKTPEEKMISLTAGYERPANISQSASDKMRNYRGLRIGQTGSASETVTPKKEEEVKETIKGGLGLSRQDIVNRIQAAHPELGSQECVILAMKYAPDVPQHVSEWRRGEEASKAPSGTPVSLFEDPRTGKESDLYDAGGVGTHRRDTFHGMGTSHAVIRGEDITSGPYKGGFWGYEQWVGSHGVRRTPFYPGNPDHEHDSSFYRTIKDIHGVTRGLPPGTDMERKPVIKPAESYHSPLLDERPPAPNKLLSDTPRINTATALAETAKQDELHDMKRPPHTTNITQKSDGHRDDSIRYRSGKGDKKVGRTAPPQDRLKELFAPMSNRASFQ